MWLKGAFPFGDKEKKKKKIKAIPQLVQIFKLKNLYDKNLFFFHCQLTATTQGKQKPK